ncbi:hypothetical protein MRX96_044115 [Rhipicephalus microplus]
MVNRQSPARATPMELPAMAGITMMWVTATMFLARQPRMTTGKRRFEQRLEGGAQFELWVTMQQVGGGAVSHVTVLEEEEESETLSSATKKDTSVKTARTQSLWAVVEEAVLGEVRKVT